MPEPQTTIVEWRVRLHMLDIVINKRINNPAMATLRRPPQRRKILAVSADERFHPMLESATRGRRKNGDFIAA
jgi:hypothetical protein